MIKMPISHFTYVMQIHSTSFHFCCLLGNQSNLPFCPRQTLTCSLPMNMLGLREDGESWERHDETRETRCTAIFTCTLTKVCFLYTAREGRDGAPQKEGGQTSEPPWCELSDRSCHQTFLMGVPVIRETKTKLSFAANMSTFPPEALSTWQSWS